ncbi:MAG TPA: ABC transporter substrate-binding protein [Candidatus Limnocylindrales bacterium]|nr:ABC transporter substrate-binding protein [Candidatus Limnocylindrales bacterium]
MRPTSRVLGIVAAAGLLAAACTGNTPSPSPSAAPSSAAPASPSAAASAPASESPAASASAAPSAATISVPTDQLLFPGKLVICIDIPYPPQEMFDEQGNPTGSDVEIAQEIAKRLGLTPEIQNSVFDTIIAAVTGGKCDMITSAQNITADRVKQVDMIPYFQAGQSFVVAKGNPAGIKTEDDLCGKSIAAETGTTEIDYINGSGDYKGQGLSKACTDKGKQAITAKEFQKDSDALLALQSGQVDAYFADSPVAGYYTVQHPDQFELSGLELGVALEGISVPKDKTGLRDAVTQALVSAIDDGAYQSILAKYGLESGAITSDVAKQLNKTQ